jgi:hypothetical protein
MKRVICLFVSLSVIVVACKKDKDDPEPSGVDCSTVTYSGTIASIVSSKCNSAGCHATGSSNGDYTSYAGIKAKFDNGSLKQRVLVEKTMPQGSSLTETQYKQFECWINAGAPQN